MCKDLLWSAERLKLPSEVTMFITNPVSISATVGLGWHGWQLAVTEAQSRWAMVMELKHSGATYHSLFAGGASTSINNTQKGVVETAPDPKGKAHVASAKNNNLGTVSKFH